MVLNKKIIFRYPGGMLVENGKCDVEIKKRIDKTKR